MKFARYFAFYAWILAVALYARSALLPDGYALHHGLPTSPFRDAVVFSLVSALECTALFFLVGRAAPLRTRSTALAAFVPWTALCMFTLMHQPPAYGAHVLWLLAIILGLIVVLVLGPAPRPN